MTLDAWWLEATGRVSSSNGNADSSNDGLDAMTGEQAVAFFSLSGLSTGARDATPRHATTMKPKRCADSERGEDAEPFLTRPTFTA